MKTVAAPTLRPQVLFLQIGRKRYQVASVREASAVWCETRNEGMKDGLSSRDMPRVTIRDNEGDFLYDVSWNGCVWGIDANGNRVEVEA